VTVYTAMCRAVHRQGASSAATAFFPRLASLDLSAGSHCCGHNHGNSSALHYFSREVISWWAGWVDIATPRAVPPPPLSGAWQVMPISRRTTK
jgi:hypothetical protein